MYYIKEGWYSCNFTSQGHGTSLLFALTIVEKLCGKEISDKVKKTALIK